jgi:hypothetical protein
MMYFDPVVLHEIGVFGLCIVFGYLIGVVTMPRKVAEEPFNVDQWIYEIQEEIIKMVTTSRLHLRYSEIGKKLGLNSTCLSKEKRFENTVAMLLCEDLVERGILQHSNTVGWPYIQLAK